MPVRELSRPAIAFWLGLLMTFLLGTPGRAHAERLPIKTYTTTDGLASDGVNRIVRVFDLFIEVAVLAKCRAL